MELRLGYESGPGENNRHAVILMPKLAFARRGHHRAGTQTVAHASTVSHVRALAGLLGALCLVAGCATTRPAQYLLSSGGIGVAVVAPPATELATITNQAGIGFVGGLVAPTSLAQAGLVGAALGVVIAPFTAAYGAAHGAECEQKLSAAYPGLSEKYGAIVQREFSPTDVQDQFIAVLRKRTAETVEAVQFSPDTGDADHEEQLLRAAALQGLPHLFVIEIQGVRIGSARDCDWWVVRMAMVTQLWNVADRKLVLYPHALSPYVTGRLTEMKSVFDDPGVLHARLVPNFEIAAEIMLDDHRFALPP